MAIERNHAAGIIEKELDEHSHCLSQQIWIGTAWKGPYD